MCRLRISLVVLMLLVAWTTPGLAEKKKEQEEAVEETPRPIAAFQLEALDGDRFVSKQWFGDRGAVIMFWRVDQPPSVRMLQDFNVLYEEYSKQDVAIVSIVAGAIERPLVRAVVKELEVAFPVLFDPERKVYSDLGSIVSPSAWFIDRQGFVVDHYPGHRRNFLRVARTNIEFLVGKIDEATRAGRLNNRASVPAIEGKNFAGGQTHYRLALRLLRKGHRDTAIKELKKAWEADPKLLEAGLKLGLLLLEEAQYDEALEVLDRALELAPTDPRVSGARGVSLIRLGQEQEGVGLLRKALEQRVDEPLLYYEMALFSERSNAPDEARSYYRQGLEVVLANRGMKRGD